MNLSKCTICGTDTKEKCKTCRSAYYCSKKCQELDKALHNILCQKMARFSRPGERPTGVQSADINVATSFKLAVLFSVASNDVDLVWIEAGQLGVFGDIQPALTKYVGRDVDETCANKHGREVYIANQIDQLNDHVPINEV